MNLFPRKAKYIFAGVALVVLLLAAGKGWPGRSTLVAPPGDWIRIESENFNYYIQVEDEDLCRDEVLEAIERLELFWEFASKPWSFPADEKVQYYRYSSRENIKDATGRDVSGLAVLGRNVVHSIHASDTHEISHVFTTRHLSNWVPGRRVNISKFWLEGIAMYYTWPYFYYCAGSNPVYDHMLGAWYGRSVHCYARDALLQGEMPSLSKFACGDDFFNRSSSNLTYPAAGSFVTFLLGPAHLDLDAIENYKSFLQDTNDCTSGEQVQQVFEEIFGLALSEAEEKWHMFLEAWDAEDYKCPCPYQWPSGL